MMIRILAVLLLLQAVDVSAQESSPDDVYDQRVEEARDEYRGAIAKQIRESDIVEVFLLQFDGLREIDLAEDDESRFLVAPYDATTRVISEKLLTPLESKKLLNALANQIEKTEHKGGMFCHYPIHGIRVYSGDPGGEPLYSNLIFSGTFCWACGNFGFSYPDGADWLDTDTKLKEAFCSVLPIPKGEIDRFAKEYQRPPNSDGGDTQDSSAAPVLDPQSSSRVH